MQLKKPEKLEKPDKLHESFADKESASKVVKLKAFSKFLDTAEALQSATALVEGRVSSSMKKFLKKHLKEGSDQLAVSDSKLGNAIKEKLGIPCVWDDGVMQLMRGLRSQLEQRNHSLHYFAEPNCRRWPAQDTTGTPVRAAVAGAY